MITTILAITLALSPITITCEDNTAVVEFETTAPQVRYNITVDGVVVDGGSAGDVTPQRYARLFAATPGSEVVVEVGQADTGELANGTWRTVREASTCPLTVDNTPDDTPSAIAPTWVPICYYCQTGGWR